MKPSVTHLKYLSLFFIALAMACTVVHFSSPDEKYSPAGHSEIVVRNFKKSSHPSSNKPESSDTSHPPSIRPAPITNTRTPFDQPRFAETKKEFRTVDSQTRHAHKAEAKSEIHRKAVQLPLFYLIDEQEIARKIPALKIEGLEVLRQDFEQQAGVGTLSENDPSYPERWHQAEITLEQRMRLWYGWNAWNAFQHEAALQANTGLNH